MSRFLERVICADIEADSLDPTLIHCLSQQEIVRGEEGLAWTSTHEPTIISDIKECSPDTYWVLHNGINYDEPALKRLLGVDFKDMLIDTLALSWYLYPKRNKHGLEGWGEEFGVPKPPVTDWVNEPIQVYVHRCEEDVKIQTKLWTQCWKHLMLLYGNTEDALRCAVYLTNKMRAVQTAARGWKLNIPDTKSLKEILDAKSIIAQTELEKGMPMVKKLKKNSRPKKPYKKDGSLSAIGIKWKELTESYDKDFDTFDVILTVSSLEKPNAKSHSQIKMWLYDLGWEPETFKYVRKQGERHPRKIPQVKNAAGDDVCDSVKRLFPKADALKYLSDMGVVNHRISILKGFLNNVNSKGLIKAEIQGFTNTLRMKHKTLVNIPSVRAPWGKEIRSLLIVKKEVNLLCGSDMCSLEDKIKQHYIFPYDPEYVKQLQTDGYDPHLAICLVADMITEGEVTAYKEHSCSDADYARLGKLRYGGKTGNYACQYGATGPTVARAAGVSEAMGETIVEGYWKLNWAIKAVAADTNVKESRGMKWQYNPVSRLWYWLKTDKDRFSTLVQGTGAFVFDEWTKNFLDIRGQINGQFHDEVITEIKEGQEDKMTKLLQKALDKVNTDYPLVTKLEIDTQFGKNYAEIH